MKGGEPMHVFRAYFETMLREADFKPTMRGHDLYWYVPGERGIIYDTAEAVMRLKTQNVLRISRGVK